MNTSFRLFLFYWLGLCHHGLLGMALLYYLCLPLSRYSFLWPNSPWRVSPPFELKLEKTSDSSVTIPLIHAEQIGVHKSWVSGTLPSETLPCLAESFFPDENAHPHASTGTFSHQPVAREVRAGSEQRRRSCSSAPVEGKHSDCH